MTIRHMTKDERPDWLDRASAGIDTGGPIVGIYEGRRFAVVRIPGHSFWSGIGVPRGYAKTSYRLIEKGQSIVRAPELHTGRAALRDYGSMFLKLEFAERFGKLP